jgi:hypothetical protein
MKKMINTTHIAGTVYQHSLELKTSGPDSKTPGTEYISGVLEIATDEAAINIVPVHFTYVTATYAKSGKSNETFNTLKNFIDNVYKTIMKDGAEKATKVRIDSAIALNEFYSERNGVEEFISVKRNEGGFVHVVGALDEEEKARNRFDCDIVITNVRLQEGDEEKGTNDKAIIKGAIFNFRNEILPVEFSVIAPGAIDYFMNLGATQTTPVFTRIKGAQISETIVRKIVEESAFGAPSIREVKNSRKDFVVDWAKAETYEWDDETSITAAEFKECIAKREITLAEIKQRNEAYKASKAQAGNAIATPAAGTFNF